MLNWQKIQSRILVSSNLIETLIRDTDNSHDFCTGHARY